MTMECFKSKRSGLVKKNCAIFLCYIICFACVLGGCSSFHEKIPYMPRSLNNKNATDNTKILFDYLNTNYGERILSGQNVAGMPSVEADIVCSVTGRYPAICSFDAATLSSLAFAHSSQQTDLIKNAILEWAKNGGIVAMQWHWFSPSGAHKSTEWPWYKSFYTKATDFNADKIFDTSSVEYTQMIDDIDMIAFVLLELQQYDIPILWRPLHEASGGWFWWGSKGKKTYLELWRTMYERFTNYHGLNNLIWVWNAESTDWYVGDDYADIVSYDVYGESGSEFNNKANKKFGDGRNVADDTKIIALSECGTVPSMSDFSDKNIRWSWFAIWCYEFIMKDGEYSEEYTSKAKLSEVYNHDLVITRDELPFALFNY